MSAYARPLPKGHEKVTYKEHLELRYLRWDYLVKAANPKESLLRSKERIVRYSARRAYFKYLNEFGFMSMEMEDVESIARVYTVSYLGLYSMEKDEAKVARFREYFKKKEGREATSKDIEKKDNYSLMAFLEQRLLECAYVLRQYCKGEAGFSYYSVFYKVSGDKWPTDEELLQSPEKHGWERLPWAKFTKIKDRFAQMVSGYSIEIDGVLYRVAVPSTSLAAQADVPFNVMETPSTSPMNPEEELIEREDNKTAKVTVRGITFDISLSERLSLLVDAYQKRPEHVQLRILKRLLGWLIRRNGFQNEMESEINQVKRMISKLNKKLSVAG